MGEPSLLDKLREWLAGIAFDVFLWCNRMTAEQYFDMLDTERGLTTDAPEMTVGDSFPFQELDDDRPKSSLQTCRWSYEDDPMFAYNTSCGRAWQFIDGDIDDNGISFCPYCGKRISS